MNVLSLFDGMSCGRIALDRIGVKVNKYYASEIDKYAIKVSKANWDDIIQLGDVNGIKQWYEDNQPSIDLMLMGSPCQGFSNASKDKLNFEHPQSKLFFVAVEIMKLVKPKYFLLENVNMKKEWQDIISDYMGVKPIKINSALFSAQSRNRLYWTNIPFDQNIEDKNIVLKDILDKENIFTDTYSNYLNSNWGDKKKTDMVKSTEDKKSHCLTASMYKGQIPTWIKKPLRVGTIKQSAKQVVNGDELIQVGNADDIKGHDILKRVYSIEGKAPTLNTCSGGNREPKIADNVIPIEKNKFLWRKLTPTECEALQTVNRGYTDHVSNTRRYQMLGNGWTVDVIGHILKPLLEDQKIVSIKPKEEK